MQQATLTQYETTTERETIPPVSAETARLARILTGNEPLKVVSYGGGLHSTAMLVKMVQDGQRPDIVLFADTGDELPETYATVEFYKRWCENQGIEFQTVTNNYGKTLGQYLSDKNILPSRRRRDCTTKFKISPMNRYLRQRYGKKAIFLKHIGYDATEKKRAEKATYGKDGKLKSPKYERLTYPLIGWNMDRVACAEVLQKASLPVPQKSGCSFCIFTKKNGWIWLYFKHPAKYQQAMKLEENSSEFWKPTKSGKTVTLYGYGLRQLAKYIEENRPELEAQFKAMGDDMADLKAVCFARGINKGSGV